jgi:Ala-tRNA(Pro) deacylase
MSSSERTPYEALRAYFLSSGTPFEEITHPPAATAIDYHRIVGSRLEQQAKALLFRRYRRDGGKDYLVYVLPGDANADIEALRAATSSTRLRLASRAELEAQTGCSFGELPPVGSIFGAELVLDKRLLAEDRLFFNAGSLDRSFVVAPADLIALERPTLYDP